MGGGITDYVNIYNFFKFIGDCVDHECEDKGLLWKCESVTMMLYSGTTKQQNASKNDICVLLLSGFL